MAELHPSTLRDRLRALPSFPEPLPVLDPEAVPEDPTTLFATWLEEAIATGERQAHSFTLTTIDEAGLPSSRTLIIKDIDERGIQFSSNQGSRKGQHLGQRPVATMLFFWRPLGRQVEIVGEVTDLGPEAAALDWSQRPSYRGQDNPDWRLWALLPAEWTFLQATLDRNHARVEYRRHGTGWQHRRPVTPAG
ncbi:pyridoxine/pyridoxamine 5'-phosphate oxidase [Granulicoccus phenolivorans]|uniref:pyridoxine/pyridoxamine 5'-phosphate oxidase n=1 Tax=Granulicoccus phenolivorans TaxID=266854 RepID=UPI00040441DF|nr:pyridoxamine 5'-phosphate oxidase family protein [Granulicoccus phenolivorans]